MTNPTTAILIVNHIDGVVPMELWGKDHKSTLIYAETCAVDNRGRISRHRMREDGDAYPTCLANGVQLKGHNDFDCLNDAEYFGLLDFTSDTVTFTDAGWQYVSRLRRERAERIPE